MFAQGKYNIFYYIVRIARGRESSLKHVHVFQRKTYFHKCVLEYFVVFYKRFISICNVGGATVCGDFSPLNKLIILLSESLALYKITITLLSTTFFL